MLTTSMITTILPVSDVDRASKFYSQTLGLRFRPTSPDGNVLFEAGNGDAIGLMPATAGAQSKHTAISFEVTDIAGEIRDLESRGVHFADYDLPDLKTVDHVATLGGEKAAWFTDSEGNILCIHQSSS